MNTPEHRAKMSANTNALWADPEYRAHHLAGMNTPEYRAKQSASLKTKWDDPYFAVRATGAIKEAALDPERNKRISRTRMKHHEAYETLRQIVGDEVLEDLLGPEAGKHMTKRRSLAFHVMEELQLPKNAGILEYLLLTSPALERHFQ